MNPTIAPYGGGLAMSVRDLAIFMANLFEGEVLAKPETLQEMVVQGPHQGVAGNRLSAAVSAVEGLICYSRAGYCGTVLYYRLALGWRLRALLLSETQDPFDFTGRKSVVSRGTS